MVKLVNLPEQFGKKQLQQYLWAGRWGLQPGLANGKHL